MTPNDCILIIPASGFSRRFGDKDKLLADLHGRPLADYAAQTAAKIGFAKMIAVVPASGGERANIFKARGFDIAVNSSAALGQTHSIEMGARAITAPPKAICIMLADMPFVPPSHIKALLAAAPKDGVMKTQYGDHTQPPAIFTGRTRDAWLQPDSMGPHLSYLALTRQEETLPLAAPYGDDIDTCEHLARAAALMPDLGL